ncbi:MAG: hypothetical protein FWG45_07460, partial [Oscillospiraceae bacterium]|nr:hypothetical protein [Oscillospiraceae bacterium]
MNVIAKPLAVIRDRKLETLLDSIVAAVRENDV